MKPVWPRVAAGRSHEVSETRNQTLEEEFSSKIFVSPSSSYADLEAK
jgi:hypothetical protein